MKTNEKIIEDALNGVSKLVVQQTAKALLHNQDPEDVVAQLITDMADLHAKMHKIQDHFIFRDISDEELEKKFAVVGDVFAKHTPLPKFFDTYVGAKTGIDAFRMDFAVAREVGLNPTLVAMVRQAIYEETHP